MVHLPSADRSTGAQTKGARARRFMMSIIDPRAYLHALRILNFYNYAHVQPRRELELGLDVEISPNATFFNGSRISIGSRTLIGARATLMAGGTSSKIAIGEDCILGPNVLITAANYRFNPQATHRSGKMIEETVTLGRNVWLGAGVVVLPGVSIGSGAIIGAGTVVAKSVADGSIVAGQGMRVIHEADATFQVTTSN